ncbi:hypothetical protein H1C71_010304 [Ictidomys tridecemlineatus]|nr:hypothetical protein H1C71_010304 [Ictidomys tridecemlineatus]
MKKEQRKDRVKEIFQCSKKERRHLPIVQEGFKSELIGHRKDQLLTGAKGSETQTLQIPRPRGDLSHRALTRENGHWRRDGSKVFINFLDKFTNSFIHFFIKSIPIC